MYSMYSPNIRSVPDACVLILLLDVIIGTDINPPGTTDITTGAVDPGGGGIHVPESLLEKVPGVGTDDRALDIDVDMGERADVCWLAGEPFGDVLPDTPI